MKIESEKPSVKKYDGFLLYKFYRNLEFRAGILEILA